MSSARACLLLSLSLALSLYTLFSLFPSVLPSLRCRVSSRILSHARSLVLSLSESHSVYIPKTTTEIQVDAFCIEAEA